MKIRRFVEHDRDSVVSLWKACDLVRPWNNPDKDIDRKRQFQPELFFVGVENNEVIASAMAGYDGHRGSVFYLAVRPDYQGRGYGEELMRYIESELKMLGCPKLNIVVRTTNNRVIGFYERLSYATDEVESLGKRLISDE